ncbi:MAG: bifunctional methylenetetrahydrofolate dehydrogenase/methenyltetrahydrofolate cyclohydrolase FolD [Verrucomicrobia bacterium]|nr:bifunctional methylenetetrahydrofolate dehydrogenase/methenyltetrahydrofolate cyclohydrolase FolD [Verrucomicrobiota bacterium]
MSAKIIDGKAISEQVLAETQTGVAEFRKTHGTTPGLAFVRVGEDPASVVYVGAKARMCERLGIQSQTFILPETSSESQVLELVQTLNKQATVHGILVQAPLPGGLSQDRVFETIDPRKDVDGFHPLNVGKLAVGDRTGFVACTPAGIHQLLIRSGIEIAGRHVVVLGRSRIVGKPMCLILMEKGKLADATVTVCHSRSLNLVAMTHQADIVIAAMGVNNFVKANMVRDGAVVVDVGITRVPDPSAKNGYRLQGDVDYAEVSKKAAWITPVPGGVGPMTIAMLMANTLKAAQLQAASAASGH